MPPWKPREPISPEFDAARLPADARSLSTGEQWAKYNEFTDRARKAKAKAEKLFKQRYAVRVQRELTALINTAGSKRPELRPSGARSGKFDLDRMQKDAERVVQTKHERRLLRIEIAEEKVKLDLSRSAEKDGLREAQQKFRQQWKKATRNRSR